ncbi:UNVERIFIED_CONTAM: hypothetical protein RMT77_009733 [Armadillidium vulgare]
MEFKSRLLLTLLLILIFFTRVKGFFLIESLHVETKNEVKDEAFCSVCHAGMALLINAKNDTEVLMFAAKLCVDLHIANEEMCDEVIALNGPDIIYIVEHAENATAEDICGMVFQNRGCTTSNPERIWKVTLPNTTKPTVDEPPLYGTENPTLKVLHLADTHFDPKYSPGANITCDQMYLCCREGSGTPEDPNDGAGFWGSMGNCDIPRWSLEALYQYISDNNPDIDFIIWTGDIVPHNSWSTSREYNLDVINEMADLVSSYFPGIPVFPAVGNHEANPANLFPQPYITDPDFDISWLYDELSEIWQRWLPSDVAKSVAYGAFYSTQIRPGLRIASVNTQYCYINNFWLVLDSNDVAKELESLANELQDAEDKGDFVYIIGHIPAGSFDCNYAWSHEFNKIVSRYESTISGIFYGHTHNDHYELYFDPQNSSRVYEVAYIAQSQTTFVDLNPGFKIYTIEGDFNGTRYRVIDHENWYLDLDQSNSINDSVILPLYSAKKDYNLPDLSPQSWLDLVYRMNEPNSTLFSDFYRHYVKEGKASIEKGCDEQCKSGILCFLVTSDSSDTSHCDDLTK